MTHYVESKKPVRFCPCCGQEILVATDITELRLRPAPLRIVLFLEGERLANPKRLFLASDIGKAVGLSRGSVVVYLSHIHRYLKSVENGKFFIRKQTSFGSNLHNQQYRRYGLGKREPLDATVDSAKRPQNPNPRPWIRHV